MDELLARAERQYSVFHRRQMADPSVVSSWVRAHRIERMARDVYRFAGSPRTWHQYVMAAVLLQGDGAAASHLSACRLWRLPGFSEAAIDVVQLRGPSQRTTIGRVHQTLYLPSHHLAVRERIPVTSIERTVFDMCGVVHPRRAERTVDNALAADLTSVPRLEIVLAECGRRGRRGTATLRALLDDRNQSYVPPESDLEDLVFAVLRSAGLELPVRQVTVGGTSAPDGRVDLVYRNARLVIEADSRRYHASWLATQADHRRDLKLAAAGYQVLRVNWWQLVHEPELFVAAVRAQLSRAA
jgi:very-short-patch-repair endonuclease